LLPPSKVPGAVIYGISGFELTSDEKSLFKEINPFGFILFSRNCDNPIQIIDLINDLRRVVDRPDAPVFIDQEGGPVHRLQPPHWHLSPAAKIFGAIYEDNKNTAYEAANLTGRLIAGQLSQLGITVNCAPVLDVAFSNTTSAIGSRSFGGNPSLIIDLANSFCEGMLSGGVLPVIKHMPGHGRATEDSHHKMPIVRATRNELRQVDFIPFQGLASMPLGMTAHVVYEKFDKKNVATFSKTIVKDIIRDEIGFNGFLITDDICMGALNGNLRTRCLKALEAGCDAVLHCSGDYHEMEFIGNIVPKLSNDANARWSSAKSLQRKPQKLMHSDLEILSEELKELIASSREYN
jgi:beta-N-acetylhexosaminidase